MGGGESAVRPKVPAESQGAAAPSRGVSFVPSSSLDVVFEPRGGGGGVAGAGGAGAVHVRIVDGDQVSLSSPDADATYRVGSNRITVNQSAGNFQLEIPRTLPELRVLIGTSVAFDRRLGKAGATDTFTIPLSRPPAKAPSP